MGKKVIIVEMDEARFEALSDYLAFLGAKIINFNAAIEIGDAKKFSLNMKILICAAMIEALDKEFGFNYHKLRCKTRKLEYGTFRYVFSKHCYAIGIKKGVIGKIIGRDRTSVINILRDFKLVNLKYDISKADKRLSEIVNDYLNNYDVYRISDEFERLKNYINLIKNHFVTTNETKGVKVV